MDHLGDDEVCDVVVDRRAQEDDPLVEKPRVDVCSTTIGTRGLIGA
jgi:hypothetical protein